jgi:hypothetical protein
MTVIPGLYLPLKAVGKHVQGCDESGDRQRLVRHDSLCHTRAYCGGGKAMSMNG